MTVKQLYDELGQLIKEGHGNTRVIANCEFNITKGNGYYNDFPLCYLKDVYYQSGDIELEFSQEEEFTEENKYKDDNNGWHFVDREGLPEDEYKVFVQYVNGDYDIAFKFAGTWRGTSGNELRGVYAWKEIVPPKEEKPC